MHSCLRRFLFLLMLLLSGLSNFIGQQTSAAGANAGQSSSNQTRRDQEPLETLKVNVNVVNIFFNVKDKHGALIPKLTKEDFQVFEDGKKQTIKYFAAETDQPLTLGILIDSSGSQRRVLPMEQEVGSQFLRDVIRDKDLAFVISFDIDVNLLQDFTSSQPDLRNALQAAKINVGGGIGGIPGAGGGPIPISNPKGTLLYDAVYLASQEKLGHEVGRKAMILLTDGEDQGSHEKLRDAVEAAQKADSIVYVILIADRDIARGFGEGEMRKLAEQTGGRVIVVGNNDKKLREAFHQISEELRTQYSIGYTPSNAKRDGSFRPIEIKSGAGYKVQARKGYYAPSG